MKKTLIMISLVCLFLAGCADKNTIQPGDIVTISYTGTIDSQVVDTGTIMITAGSGQIIKGLEEAVLSMKNQETKTLSIQPKDGYDYLYQQNNIQQIPQTLFEKANISIEKEKYIDFWGVFWRIKGTSTDSSGTALILFDVNPLKTYKDVDYTLTILSLKKHTEKQDKAYTL